MKRVCVIGHFGFGQDLLNGQTIKTKIIASEVEKNVGKDEIVKIDTHGGLVTLIRLPFILLYAIIFFKNVIIMPAYNGLRAIVPLLVLCNFIFNKKLHYVVIGGWLPKFIKTKLFLRNLLKRFDYIYVETSAMKNALFKMDFKNVKIMPNCKNLQILKESDLVYDLSEPYKLCTFSRVMKEKGIEDAINAVKLANEKTGKIAYKLDIYGQVDSEQIEWFERIKETFPDYIQYKGTVPFDKTVDVLKNYHILLFPTRFYTEGIPGTIIDAYAAGIPVIASMWESFSDIIDDGDNGFIVPAMNIESLASKITWSAQNKDILINMKEKCLDKAKNYLPENAVKQLIDSLV